MAPKVLSLPPHPVAAESAHEFHLVAGAKQEIMLHWSVRSLLHHAKQPISIYVHSDGTFDQPVTARFLDAFPGAVVVSRNEADVIADRSLAAQPRLRALRASHRWVGIKAVDPFLWGTADAPIWFDTDIIVLGSLERLLGSTIACWSKDVWWSVNVPKADLARITTGPMPQLNGGLGKTPRSLFDPSLLERHLSEGLPVPDDQVFHSLLVSAGEWELLDEDQYVIATEPGVKGLETKHYTTPFRFLFWEEGVPVTARALGLPLKRWLALRP